MKETKKAYRVFTEKTLAKYKPGTQDGETILIFILKKWFLGMNCTRIVSKGWLFVLAVSNLWVWFPNDTRSYFIWALFFSKILWAKSQGIPRFISVFKRAPHRPYLTEINQINTFTVYFLNVHRKIGLISMPSLSKRSTRFRRELSKW